MPAPSTFCRLFGSRHILVKTDPDLCGALKNMEKLSEREPEKRDNDRYGVSERHKLIAVAAQPRGAHRQQQTRETDGEQQDQRQDIFPEKLKRRGSFIAHPAV